MAVAAECSPSSGLLLRPVARSVALVSLKELRDGSPAAAMFRAVAMPAPRPADVHLSAIVLSDASGAVRQDAKADALFPGESCRPDEGAEI